MNSICRKSNIYPVFRALVPDDKVFWSVPWHDYSPPDYSVDFSKCSWADPDINDKNFKPKWNTKDGGINRESYSNNLLKCYKILHGVPLNPKGRTGLKGRGRLGRWGPNHAADSIVTRWKKDKNKYQVLNEIGLPILQFLAILRNDCKKWAIPGGFLNVNESSTEGALRELFEEAVNEEKFTDDDRKQLKIFFAAGNMIYKGYVDDPRNTDNAWIETTATNFHDHSGKFTDNLQCDARDDAVDVRWIDICDNMNIYESHHIIIKAVYDLHLNAFNSYMQQIHPLIMHIVPPLKLSHA